MLQARALARRFPSTGELSDWCDDCQEFLSSWDDDLTSAKQAIDKQKRDSWDEWQEKALQGGAREMHRLTTLKAKCTPTVVQTHPGFFSNEPQALLRQQGDERLLLVAPDARRGRVLTRSV